MRDVGGVGQVDYQRMVGGAPFGRENAANGVRAAGVRAKVVHRFGWKRDQLAGPQQADRATNCRGRRHDYHNASVGGRAAPGTRSERGGNLLESKLLRSV